ncbi:glucosaminidase domain-containing protein [Luteibacter sp. UNCMF366Tsu5.1]|uniref:glucosaminidase domain-containing protein n=1 Tax=Luteibacter sp. UNCMF366Tsu5.1 TaxID=1502758 RepID=UPI00116086C7|nr:glucosaminidase domain-containing protein [Luteibacter sp. UNCMF366Tsu5.1]
MSAYTYASLQLGLTDSTGCCAKNPNNPKCKLPIVQPAITKVFGSMGKELGIDPLFVMSSALQESGWDMKHIYETNAKSGGKPLNNLFGMTRPGKSNLAYPSFGCCGGCVDSQGHSYFDLLAATKR